MKTTLLILATGFMLLISACGSERKNNADGDSMMADSALMDTATMSNDTTAASADTSGTDSTSTNLNR